MVRSFARRQGLFSKHRQKLQLRDSYAFLPFFLLISPLSLTCLFVSFFKASEGLSIFPLTLSALFLLLRRDPDSSQQRDGRRTECSLFRVIRHLLPRFFKEVFFVSSSSFLPSHSSFTRFSKTPP